MEASKVREIFLALKLHYSNEKYDYTKFTNRKLRGKLKSDTIFYEKFAEKFSSENGAEFFFVANFMRNFHKNFNIPTFVGDYYTTENFEYLKKWYAYLKSNLLSNYSKYMETVEIEDLIKVGKSLPKVFEEYLQGKISLDILCTFVYNNSNNSEIATWEFIADSDPLFGRLYFVVKKHILFLKYKGILQ